MSTIRTLVLLAINYVPIFLWMFFFRMGLKSFFILLPVILFCILMNALISLGRRSAYLWCVHLFIASVIGILLQNYLYLRFVDPDAQLVLLCFGEIFSLAVIILLGGLAAGGVSGARLRKSGREAPSYVFFDPALKEDMNKPADVPEEDEDFDEFEENVLSDKVSDDELLDEEEEDSYIEEIESGDGSDGRFFMKGAQDE